MALALLLTGCSGGPGSDGSGEGRNDDVGASNRSLSDVDTGSLRVPREAFCDRVPAAAARSAVGGAVARSTAYDAGDRAEVVPGVRDVAHEFSCGYESAEGATARAWVFAPPVSPERARSFVDAARVDGCTPTPGAAALGEPTVALECRTPDRVTASHRGLVDDAWVTCEVSAPPDQSDRLDQRASQWCAAVLTALSR